MCYHENERRVGRKSLGRVPAGRPQLAGESQAELCGKAQGVLPRHPSPVIRAWLCSEPGVLMKFSRALSLCLQRVGYQVS